MSIGTNYADHIIWQLDSTGCLDDHGYHSEGEGGDLDRAEDGRIVRRDDYVKDNYEGIS